MELPQFHPSSLSYFFTLPQRFIPENYVHWTQTSESHVYTAEIPGVRKEEIRVEVEDSRYLIIRTEATADPFRRFNRKFRLPVHVDVDGISAEYIDGVLTVKVPRRAFFIEPIDVPQTVNLLARAA